jgi:hypothetical protein
MTTSHRRALHLVAGLAATIAVTACGSSTPAAAPTTRRAAAPTTAAAPPTTASGPLVGPETTPVQDGAYFSDLARIDPDLATYVNSNGNVALQALLTDGSAFCAFLRRGGGIDNAMTSLVIGAKSVQSQTHLPASVTTFNAIDATSLVVLCPDEQSLIPAADRTKIRQLAAVLAGQ